MALGFGIDTWCGDALVTGRFARGRMNLILALYRRLITPRGKLRGIGVGDEDELTYGLDLAALCGTSSPEDSVKTMPGRIKAELEKDERVADVFVLARPPVYSSDGTAALFFEVSVAPEDESGNFQFTVKVESVTTSLLLGGASS